MSKGGSLCLNLIRELIVKLDIKQQIILNKTTFFFNFRSEDTFLPLI